MSKFWVRYFLSFCMCVLVVQSYLTLRGFMMSRREIWPLALPFSHPLLSLFALCCLVTQSCPTLYGPIDCSPPGSSVQEFSRQECWSGVHISLSRGSSCPRDWMHVSCMGGWILYCWTTRKTPASLTLCLIECSDIHNVLLCTFSHSFFPGLSFSTLVNPSVTSQSSLTTGNPDVLHL